MERNTFLSLRLTFCLSPQTQIVYFCIFWSIKAMLSSQCGLQYCRSSQHKNLALHFPLYIADTTVYSDRPSRLQNVTTAFLNIRKQPSMWFKMFVWFNLSITLYICSHVQMCVPLVVAFGTPTLQFWNDKVAETARRQGIHNYLTTSVCVFVFEPIIITGT